MQFWSIPISELNMVQGSKVHFSGYLPALPMGWKVGPKQGMKG